MLQHCGSNGWVGIIFFNNTPCQFTQIYCNNRLLHRNCCFGFMASCNITPPMHVGHGLLYCSKECAKVPPMYRCHCKSEGCCILKQHATASSTNQPAVANSCQQSAWSQWCIVQPRTVTPLMQLLTPSRRTMVYSFVTNYCVLRMPHLLSHVTVQLTTLWVMGEQNTS